MEKRVNPRYSPSEARNSKAIQQTNGGILGERDIDKLMLLWNLPFIKKILIDFLVLFFFFSTATTYFRPEYIK